MKEDYKRYVDQITQNVIALLHICHLKNLNQDQSYRSVQTDLNIHICFVMRDTNAYGVPGSRGKVPKTPG